jgi:hypothetical protein
LLLRDAEIRNDPQYHQKTIDDDIPAVVIAKIRQNAIAFWLTYSTLRS